MDNDQSRVTERILDLTLEIIYLLTGEDYKVVTKMSGDPVMLNNSLHETSPNTAPHSLPTEVTGAKILEVIQKMIELLTREVPIRCQDVAVYFSMEEWEYLEGHKELYKDVMMASQPGLTSPDGSSNGNPSENCPCPPFSPQESTQEGPTIPQHHQGEEQKDIKVEEEETLLLEMTMKSEQEESSLCVETTGRMENISEDRSFESPDNKNIEQHFPGATVTSPDTQNLKDVSNVQALDLRSETTERPTELNKPEESSFTHERDRTGEPSLSCSVCRKSFTKTRNLVRHQKIHTTELRYSCPKCGKCFRDKSNLVTHQQRHAGERPHSCPVCQKCFAVKWALLRHQSIHTGERSHACPECGKCFSRLKSLVAHQRLHAAERSYSCPECGKNFRDNPQVKKYHRRYAGERPHSCSVCGKCYTKRSSLFRHLRIHTGERPRSCSDCRKSLSRKISFAKHQKSHTGECSYSCPECGKCFGHKRSLLRHQKYHSSE